MYMLSVRTTALIIVITCIYCNTAKLWWWKSLTNCDHWWSICQNFSSHCISYESYHQFVKVSWMLHTWYIKLCQTFLPSTYSRAIRYVAIEFLLSSLSSHIGTIIADCSYIQLGNVEKELNPCRQYTRYTVMTKVVHCGAV